MIHPSVKIHPSARINCKHLSIGEGGAIGRDCVIEGYRVQIGRSFWMDEGAVIGGGSCHDPLAYLEAGDFLHMGRNSQLNIARGIKLGDEVGIGIHTQVFTHGAYLNELDGFPVQFASVQIGSRVWLPNAWVNPGVTIGNDNVVTPNSLINNSFPDGCLIGGSPAVIIKKDYYPKELTIECKAEILQNITNECITILNNQEISFSSKGILIEDTYFDCNSYIITGPATSSTDIIMNQLRRHGIRFRYSRQDNQYIPWS